MDTPNPSRRQFIRATATGIAAASALGLTARSYGRVAGANDRIRIGQIGCGNRGAGAHMPGVHRHAKSQNVEISAVCDVWTEPREKAAARVKKWYGAAPFECTDYRELLTREDVDAVMIASCDFHHARMLGEIARAGKDAYCEKPLAMRTDELSAAVRAVNDAKIIVQIGTQRRSDPVINGIKKLLTEGAIGKVNRIEFFRNADKPNWYKRLDRLPIAASEVDWPSFLMHRPSRPFSDLALAGWYGYREFCGGNIGQFLSHYADAVNYITGSTYPTSAVGHGQTFIWNDEYKFDCRDQVQTSLIYPEGFLFTYSTNFGNAAGSRSMIYGTEGVIDIDAGTISRGPVPKRGEPEGTPIEEVTVANHFLNWLECLRSRRQPVAPIEAGHQHSIACIMADQAMLTGRRQVYDRQQDQVRAG